MKLSNNELIQIGSSIGSDVPFFINGKIQYIEGIGDILTQLNNIKISTLELIPQKLDQK